MKPTHEQIQAGINGFYNGNRTGELSSVSAIVEDILTAALSASPAGVVKPLEWTDAPYMSTAETLHIRYVVTERDDDTGPHWYMTVQHLGSVYARRDTMVEIKAAAFADYSARIMSAIEPAGVGVDTPPPSTHVEWSEMASAPKDGTMLRLLVNPDQREFTAFDDSLTPFETIGFNNLENTEEDRWEFAGWDWQQDCFITGRGEVIGWAQMSPKPDGSAATSEYKPVVCVGHPTIDKLISGEHVETEKVILIPASDLSPSTQPRAAVTNEATHD